MTRDELLIYHMDCVDKMHQILKKKNADYSGSSNNPFENLQLCELFGVCSTEIGMMTRITDKFSRLMTFVRTAQYQVTDESFEDTVLDMANYLILLAAYRKSKSDLRTEFNYGKTEVP